MTVYHMIMSVNVSVYFNKFERGWKNIVVAYFVKLGSFYGVSCKKNKELSRLGWILNQ
jgi:hypothetical protein